MLADPIEESQAARPKLCRQIPLTNIVKLAFDVKPAPADAHAEDLFGGAPKAGDAVELALTKEIAKPENAPKAREIIVDFIESQKLLKRENKSATKLIDCCAKANAALEEGIKIGLGPDAKTEGVEAQLKTIDSQLIRIRAFLAKAQGNAEN